MLALEPAERSTWDSDSAAQTRTSPLQSAAPNRGPPARVARLPSPPLGWRKAIDPALPSGTPPGSQVVASDRRCSAAAMD